MTQYERDLSNLSYTNKDFGTIYPELLDLVKKISYKWDPSESDESDPGVVLLKLAALMADKNNYNIDKNILETFPLSVTQLQNARQLFEQCGYCMSYYQSATTTASMTLVKDGEPKITDDDRAILSPNDVEFDKDDVANIRYYVIPKYTMISDLENSVVYTTTEDATLPSDGRTIEGIPVVQGIINTYTINGESVITAANLDYNNRLYFTETDIAENGIFIEFENGSTNEWTKVDNLVLQRNGTYCYKFGTTSDGSSCYIEFPDDIDTLIGNGITIHYLRTQGIAGNVGKKRLCQFYTDVTATRYIDPQHTQEVIVSTYESATSGNVYITNMEASTNGADPESIDSAYRNYQKIKTTFETLVSLRDYENFLYTNKNVSNCFVCDRTNDIQSSYKVVDGDNTAAVTVSKIHKVDSEPEMNAFDLKVYGLSYVANPTTTEAFNRSFHIIDQKADTYTEWVEILNDTDELKSLQHNYKSFEYNRIIMLMNRYPIISRIIPQYKLETKQQEEVLARIVTDLYKVLNSRALDFGDPIEYDVVYDTIMGADPRIKAIVLEDITYQTYAAYRGDDDNIHEIRIDTLSSRPEDTTQGELWDRFRKEIYAKSVLAGKTQLFAPDARFPHTLGHRDAELVLDGYRLTTNTDIVAVKDPNKDVYSTVTLKPNENIVFTAPNLIDDVPYSSYVKFIHNIGLGIDGRDFYDHVKTEDDKLFDPDDNYTLKPNEYIVFFWKTEDDEYAPYQFIKYTGNSGSKIKIISSSFRMLKQRQPDPRILPYNIPEAIIEGLPTEVTSTTDTVKYNIPGSAMSFTSYISALSGEEFVLTGTNTITTKKTNTIHINNLTNGTRNVYWILNDVADGKCVLFEPCVDGSELQSYTLQTGEYFIYSNDTRTQLHLLGSGTKIERTASTNPWSCPEINYDDFIAEGVNYFDGKDHEWFVVPEGDDVYATEMEFYQIGPDNTIILEYQAQAGETNPYEDNAIIFDRSGTYLGTKPTKEELKNGAPNDTLQGYVKRTTPVSLFSFKIKYRDINSSTSSLPYRNTEATAWTAYSILNINCSPTKSQSLDANQTLIIKDATGRNETTLPRRDKDNSTAGVYIATDRTVSLTGGTDLDCTTVDLVNRTIIPLGIYAYRSASNETGTDGNWIFDMETVTLEVIPSTNVVTYKLEGITLPVGKYLIPISLDAAVDSLTIAMNDDEHVLKTIAGSSEYNTLGIHYLEAVVTESEDTPNVGKFTLIVKAKLTAETPSFLTFEKLFKFTVPNLEEVYEGEEEYKITDFDTKDVAQVIAELDSDKQFNYTYVVPDEDLVRNPLIARSFVDTNHIFNPYTICRWDTSSTLNKLSIITKVK